MSRLDLGYMTSTADYIKLLEQFLMTRFSAESASFIQDVLMSFDLQMTKSLFTCSKTASKKSLSVFTFSPLKDV